MSIRSLECHLSSWTGRLLRHFPRRFGTCDSALAAADFDALPVRPSRNTLLAALAAFGLVTLPLAIYFTSLLCVAIPTEVIVPSEFDSDS